MTITTKHDIGDKIRIIDHVTKEVREVTIVAISIYWKNSRSYIDYICDDNFIYRENLDLA